eukprot:TRINITY_DN1268_c0_g1_i3.p1 TRINITY_DN1268_c0_g1~~TRINITY_DN1268_c0_g1_i3.p1  ORF type:complete len:198 (-),score=6.31 TRINITY_DN1268_c0_g1_i3:60-653(-)
MQGWSTTMWWSITPLATTPNCLPVSVVTFGGTQVPPPTLLLVQRHWASLATNVPEMVEPLWCPPPFLHLLLLLLRHCLRSCSSLVFCSGLIDWSVSQTAGGARQHSKKAALCAAGIVASVVAGLATQRSPQPPGVRRGVSAFHFCARFQCVPHGLPSLGVLLSRKLCLCMCVYARVRVHKDTTTATAHLYPVLATAL